MTVTEEKANEMWCPMVRASASEDDNNSCNRLTKVLTPPFSMCIGSLCMMWRWDKNPVINRFIVADSDDLFICDEDKEPKRPENVPMSWKFSPFDGESPAGWIEPHEDACKRRRGFCGIAGKGGAA